MEKLLGVIIAGFFVILFFVLGYLVWIKEKITLFHSYHYDKVTEENKKAFCKISGIGLIVIGIGVLVAGRFTSRQIFFLRRKNMMKCSYCGSEMEEGVLFSRVVPEWVKKGEKKGTLLNCIKKFTHNELPAQCCVKCKKMILDI